MDEYREEIPTYRRLNDPTRPLWGLSVRALLVLGACLVVGWLFVKSAILPPGPSIALAVTVLSWPVTVTAVTDGQAVSPVREIGAVIVSLMRPGAERMPDELRGGLVVRDARAPDTEQGAELPNWTETLEGAREESGNETEISR